MGIDVKTAKAAASGRWHEIADRVLGISDDFLSAKHGPCPKCGGTDRWRVFDDFRETGGAVCNQCGKFGDGFEVARWFRSWGLDEAITRVCDHLGVVDSKKPKASPGKSSPKTKAPVKRSFDELEFIPWRDRQFAMWAATKRPITKEGVILAGGQFAKYRGLTVLAIPIQGRDGTPSGYAIYNATGGTIDYRPEKDAPVEKLKVKVIGAAKESGWIGRFLPGKETFKAEGVSDALAILSVNPQASAISNAFGAGENPTGPHNRWMLKLLEGATVYTVHDRDVAGRDGSTWIANNNRRRPGWSTAIAIVAKESRNVELPFELAESHGKDVRDFLCERIDAGATPAGAYAELEMLAEFSEVVPKPDGLIVPEEEPEVKEEQEITIDDDDRHHVDDPHRLAVRNLEKYSQYGRTLKYWNQTWYRWVNGVYQEISSDHLMSRVNASIKEEFDAAWKIEFEKYKVWKRSDKFDPTMDKGPPKVRKVKGGLVRDVYEATKGICTLGSGQKMHHWIEGEGEEHKGVCVATNNGVLNITKAISDEEFPRSEILIPHTPNWFSTAKIELNFDETAQCPSWIQFLEDVFNGDDESIDVLQKWFGYLLTPDNSLQKILFVIGDKRSGKGTIIKIMQAILGESNVAMPKLVDFTKNFALQSLANKTAAIITDARLSKRVDETLITETLLAISGGDPQDIERKYKDTLSGYHMKIRFTIFSNLIPDLRDLSSAFVSRCVFLHMPNSYLGREDMGLLDRLRQELPGILNWAILGRHKLNQSKRIDQPQAGSKFVDEFVELTNPVLFFLNQHCEFGKDYEVDTKDAFEKWEQVCKDNKVEKIGSVQSFARNIRAIKPNMEVRQVRIGASRARRFVGMRLIEDDF
jgi:P4 family phage/plasmid primase-like protien